MQIKIVREQFKPDSTVGRLLVDGSFECFTLEDGVRTNKVFGETAIPPGTYRVTVEDSPRFKRKLPRLHDVPNFSGVLIHPGNKAADTHGCVLVGQQWQPGAEVIGASRAAFDALFAKINAALARGDGVSIEIEQTNAPADLLMRSVRPPRGPAPAGRPEATSGGNATRKAKPVARPKSKAKSKAKAKTKAGAKAVAKPKGRATTAGRSSSAKPRRVAASRRRPSR